MTPADWPRRSAPAAPTPYEQPSFGQPGNAYHASVTVAWRISWTGSGDEGGVLTAALPLRVSFSLRVAQGEALVTSP